MESLEVQGTYFILGDVMKLQLSLSTASSLVEVFHGDDFGTKAIEVERMFSNKRAYGNQEGFGVYFTDRKSTAETYGKDLVSAYINPRKFIDSQKTVKALGTTTLLKILSDLYDSDNESAFYLITDYAVDIMEPNQMRKGHLRMILKYMMGEQIRHFQIDMCQRFDIHSFYKAWNTHTKYQGTKRKQMNGETFYAISDTDIDLKQLK